MQFTVSDAILEVKCYSYSRYDRCVRFFNEYIICGFFLHIHFHEYYNTVVSPTISTVPGKMTVYIHTQL